MREKREGGEEERGKADRAGGGMSANADNLDVLQNVPLGCIIRFFGLCDL